MIRTFFRHKRLLSLALILGLQTKFRHQHNLKPRLGHYRGCQYDEFFNYFCCFNIRFNRRNLWLAQGENRTSRSPPQRYKFIDGMIQLEHLRKLVVKHRQLRIPLTLLYSAAGGLFGFVVLMAYAVFCR